MGCSGFRLFFFFGGSLHVLTITIVFRPLYSTPKISPRSLDPPRPAAGAGGLIRTEEPDAKLLVFLRLHKGHCKSSDYVLGYLVLGLGCQGFRVQRLKGFRVQRLKGRFLRWFQQQLLWQMAVNAKAVSPSP